MLIFNPLASFTRPADTTAYASGDLVANSVTAGSVVPLSFKDGGSAALAQFRIVRARLSKSTTTTSNASFRLHLYQATVAGVAPIVANGDNGAWSSTGAATGASCDWLGNIDITSMLAGTDGAFGTGSLPAGSEMYLRSSNLATIYGLLEVRAAYTPGSAEVFSVTLEEVVDF